MLIKKLSLACAIAALTAGVAFSTTEADNRARNDTNDHARSPGDQARCQHVPAATPAATKVNLNTATADQLDALPQVGRLAPRRS